jgi:hypothetical protein
MMDQGVHPLEAIRRIMNDQSVNVRNWVTDFVSEIHKSYGTSIGEITEILKDIAKEKSHDE